MKLIPGSSLRRERDDQPHRVLEVVEIERLDRRVHVAEWHRDEAGRHAGAAEVDRVGVRRRRGARDLDRERDALRLGRLVQQLEDVLVDRRASGQRRAAAEQDLPLVVRISAAHVAGVRDVDRDGEVGLGGERRRARAGEVADLLLYRGHGDHVAGRAAAFGDAAGGLERDVAAHPVVEGAGGDAVAVQGQRRAVPHDVVAGPDETAQLVAVLRADVEIEVVRLDRLAVLAALALLPSCGDHAGNGAAAGEDVDALAGHHGRVPAARLAHRGEPVVAEIRDDDGDLVDVADERERRPARRAGHAHPRVAEDVGGDLADGAAASRHTAAAARSWPEGPGVVSRRSSRSGRGTAADTTCARLRCSAVASRRASSARFPTATPSFASIPAPTCRSGWTRDRSAR